MDEEEDKGGEEADADAAIAAAVFRTTSDAGWEAEGILE